MNEKQSIWFSKKKHSFPLPVKPFTLKDNAGNVPSLPEMVKFEQGNSF
jgi:hypothetical protein